MKVELAAAETIQYFMVESFVEVIVEVQPAASVFHLILTFIII